MIILFSNCGFAIIAFLFYLCGSNRVAEVFADFIVNNCYLIFAVLLIINFLISFYFKVACFTAFFYFFSRLSCLSM